MQYIILNNKPFQNISAELRSWMKEGPRKETIADEDTFCNIEILRSILKSKEIFDQLEGYEMRKARTKSNPFEIIHGVFFLNRAAMKMANMDACFDFMFTNPSINIACNIGARY
jgi:cap1 methyltransferase